MQISFGKRIPISTCNIYNKKTKEFESATLYEADCKDQKDVFCFKNLESSWEYKDAVAMRAFSKYLIESEIKPNGINGINSQFDKFYTLVTKDGHIASICETQPYKGDINIKYLESNPNKQYKYAGQAMLASVLRLESGSDHDIKVCAPSKSALDFYSKVCEFKDSPQDIGFELSQENIDNFVQKVEEKICGKIIDYQG